MARGINKVILIGNCGSDPEVRYLANGNAVANFSLATSEAWKDKQTGEQQERTEWHKISIFGKLAEIAGQYLRKGSKCYLEGKLQTRKWTDKQGIERYSTEVVLDINGQLQMLDGKSVEQHTENRGAEPRHQPQQSANAVPAGDGFEDDSIPF